MKNELNYENLFEILTTILPKKWSKAILFAIYDGNSYIMKYYFKKGAKDTYRDGETANIATDKKIINAFLEIDKEISVVRDSLNSKDKWTIMVIEYTNDKTFRVAFDYVDVQERELEILETLEEKYIK